MAPIRLKTKKPIMSTATIEGPKRFVTVILKIIPMEEATTEKTAEQIVTALKLLKTLIAERDGKIIKAETRREPTSFMARTMMIAIIMAITRL